MKDKIFYAFEGIVIGLISHHVWEDIVIPVIVSALCAIVTVTIQHFYRQWLNTRNNKLPKFKQNGQHEN